ncbi:MAG: DUF2282 domain-containing protein [Sphingorhabdus sp.]
MAQAVQTKLITLASALISVGALAACGDGAVTVRYDTQDKGLTMPEPEKALREKCHGIAPAQANDCATIRLNDCAGTADKDYLPEKWKYVKTGSCEARGGTLEPPEKPYPSQK